MPIGGLATPTLADEIVRLEPLAHAHEAGMAAAVAGPRETFGWTSVPTVESVPDYIDTQLRKSEEGDFAPFAQIDAASDRIVGHTSYLTPRWWPDGRLYAIEVGTTWLTPSAQGTAINSAAKLLLFRHAFETWGVERIDLKTDARNERSRAGIVAVGGRFEGVLRAWQPSVAQGETGVLRDTAMFSILAAEWPEVERMLAERIARKRGTSR